MTGRLLLLALVAALAVAGRAAEPTPAALGPRSPAEAAKAFRLRPGFAIDLVASEPLIVDPVAMSFDENHQLFVAEMPGYPNGGKGVGPARPAGRIVRLADQDGDGAYETAVEFVGGLRFPTAVCPWRGGLLVGDAPDLLWAIDCDGDGVADERRVLYTGFGTENIQQLLNSLQFHGDGWIYGCNGGNGSLIRSVERPAAPPVDLRGRHFRFDPDRPGSLEACTGGGQYGLTADDSGAWFTCTNNQHLRHLVLPAHYLRRQPLLATPRAALDIPDHGAAARVFRTSPLEGWRVERTRRRAEGPSASRFADAERVPGGFITSACGLLAYRGDAFPARYAGRILVCDPANNLIHEDRLTPRGGTFVAERAEADCEFLTSVDPWFRPVFLAPGPDGAVYVADFYREVIETPLSLPPDLLAKLDLASRRRGRIWRIRPEGGAKPTKPPMLRSSGDVELTDTLKSCNAWTRLTAQRLLQERLPLASATMKRLEGLTPSPTAWQTRLAAMELLARAGALPHEAVAAALRAAEPELRANALLLAEPFFSPDRFLAEQAAQLAADGQGRVRFQLALSAGALPPDLRLAVIQALAKRDGDDEWFRQALLSSTCGMEVAYSDMLMLEPAASPLLRSEALRLALRAGSNAELARLAEALPSPGSAADAATFDLVAAWADGLGERGLASAALPLSPTAKKKLETWSFVARSWLSSPERGDSDRLRGLPLLRLMARDEVRPLCRDWLSPEHDARLQRRLVALMCDLEIPGTMEVWTTAWPQLTPAVRQEMLEVALQTQSQAQALIDALAAGRLPTAEIPQLVRQRLAKHADGSVRQKATLLFNEAPLSSRDQVVARYRPALERAGNAEAGRLVFRNVCASCHVAEGQGHAVGPDLKGVTGAKSPEALLADILVPNREVDPRFQSYVVLTRQGKSCSGLIAAETEGSLLLRRAEGAEELILRRDVERLQGSGLSLMPEGLEEQITVAQMADLLAYLKGLAGK